LSHERATRAAIGFIELARYCAVSRGKVAKTRLRSTEGRFRWPQARRSVKNVAVGRTSDARERLIDAAIVLFWRQGFSAVSVDQICEAASVRKGSFYHFFESKEVLALEALETHWERRRPMLDALFSPSLPPLDRLEKYFEFIIERQKELHAEHGKVLGCFYFSLGTGNVDLPAVNVRVREVIAVYERYYANVLVEAEKAGLLSVRDPEEKARSLFRFIEGQLADARLRNTLDDLSHLPRLAFEFLGIERRGRGRDRSRKVASRRT
jgi:TetR/AcrR family transcriptional regulator, transcriptional repressor for nem operon